MIEERYKLLTDNDGNLTILDTKWNKELTSVREMCEKLNILDITIRGHVQTITKIYELAVPSAEISSESESE